MTASCPGVYQSEGFRSAARNAVVRVCISWPSTAAAPRRLPPAARICRAAARMSSCTEIVVMCRSPVGPARSISSR